MIAEGGNGATTVAGTMYIANMVGIRVFVTGGIGGVHRGAEETMVCVTLLVFRFVPQPTRSCTRGGKAFIIHFR